MPTVKLKEKTKTESKSDLDRFLEDTTKPQVYSCRIDNTIKDLSHYANKTRN